MVMLDPVDPPRKVRPELDIPPELEEVVLKALAKKREQRFQTMARADRSAREAAAARRAQRDG